MRRNWRARALWAAAVGLLALLTVAPVAAAAAPGAISGKVTDVVTESGIAGFNVCASSGVYEECDETTATGEYTIAGLPEGDYIVYFEFFDDSDYVNQYYDGQPSWEVANPVHVTSGETASNIDAELQMGGRIAGTVTKAIDGAPLGGIEVCAHEDRAPNYWAVRCTNTTANGQYTIHGLATGNYKVEFSPDWPGEPGDEFPAQFFNDKSSLAEAEWVGVTALGTTAGIDGHLGPKPTQPVVMPPTTTPLVTQPPSAKPRIVVKLSAPTQRLSVIGKSGVIRTSCRLSAAGRCVVVAMIRAKDAKVLGLKVKKPAKSLTIGRGKARLGKAGSARVKVKLSRKVLNALKGASKLKIRLTVTASGPGRKTTVRSVNLTARS